MINNLKLGDDIIDFSKNKNQWMYFNHLFNDDLTLKTDYYEYAYWGAFRCGKSFSQQLAVFLVCFKYPNTKALYVRATYDQLGDSVIKQFLDCFKKYGVFNYKITDREVYFHNGSVLKFRAFDRDSNILSSEYDLIAVCQAEDIKEELALQLFGRLSGSALPRPILLTEGNPANTWPKRRYKDSTKDEMDRLGIFLVEGKTEDNLHNLPEGYIDRLRQNYPKFWFDRYVLGVWENLDEMVFSEYNDGMVVDPMNPPNPWKRQAGFDYGWRSPSAFVWGAIDYDGVLWIYDDWEDNMKTPNELAEVSKRHGKQVIVADYSIKRPDRDGRSLWDDLLRQGMNLLESNKQELANITLVNALMRQGRLKITKNCVNLIREIKGYKWKRLKLGQEKNLPDEPIQVDNHAIDALLYLVASLEELRSIDPLKEAEKKTLAAMTMRKETRRALDYA